ncbi:CLUMA_CG012582, isoform A [Clunio marinus]|uniref:Protein phosphatase methylesterase 1 n=1 Tax=Clunio marinus TaxID=568069 RepID=A0A1J1IGP1_9DIPT|nr:CLUMA_CG012582, isoform A [Clunio marinus]
MSDLQKNLLKSKLPPIVPKTTKGLHGRYKDYSPSQWNQFFHDYIDVMIDEKSVFRCYRSKPAEKHDALLLILLHGGGYNALSWAVFSKEITSIIHCECLAIDFRGHGNTVTDDDYDLSAETMANDISKVIKQLYKESPTIPNMTLMGHSMGGSVAVHIAHMKLISSLLGIIVIDVVEGTALESLQSMQSFLRSRPNYFKSIPNAIEWCVRSGQIRNLESAKVSMPGQIINCETKKLATAELPLNNAEESSTGITSQFSIPEDAEETSGDGIFQSPAEFIAKKYTWRIDLSRSEKFWKGWFENLSDKFLEVPVPKLLILAGIDNLDKKLTVGQMQGKFQLQVLARTGHAVHEDQPHQVAETLASYLLRNKFAEGKSEFVYHMPAC